MAPSPLLRLVPPGRDRRAADGPAAWNDIALAGFLFVTHAFGVVAFAAGWSPGEGAAGYAAAIALLAGRELLRELGSHLRRARR